MKTNMLTTRHMPLQEYSLTSFNGNKSRRNMPGVVKLLPAPPPPPDAEKIKELNDLAATYPFCVSHKVKKHDPL